ncbi:MAG: hypothetical protein ACH350_08070 [Parachlamydiaceae bacterium]
MSIPFNDNLSWSVYQSNPQWHENQPVVTRDQCGGMRALQDIASQGVKEPVIRGVQCLRDAARLVLKVPIRSLLKPIWLEKNWKEYERAKINAKLVGYSFVQLLSVPPKFLVAIAALMTSVISSSKSQQLLDKSEYWTAHLDGRAAQLEALKEVGRPHAGSREEYLAYKEWLYGIEPRLCTQ